MLFATAGCHPTRTIEFEKYNTSTHEKKGASYLNKLRELVVEDKNSPKPSILAYGEIGLDYDRLNFSPSDVQRR